MYRREARSGFQLFHIQIQRRCPMVARATLVCHRGAHEVTRDELAPTPCPPPQGRWRPVPHAEVLTHAEHSLTDAGYGIERETLALSSDSAKFFGTLTLRTPL